MRRAWLVVVLVATGLVVSTAAGRPDEPSKDKPLHSEKGLGGQVVIETETQHQRPVVRPSEGKFVAAGVLNYHRLVVGGTLWGTQVREITPNATDTLQCLTTLSAWDAVVVAGANHAFDMRQEPLTYYHRSGPIGAVFTELRTRKNGADAKAPVANLGLEAGTVACYALPGQKLTVYEADPVLKRLIADTDKYFTYVTDARKRGAEVEIREGDRRAKLKEDKDRKYALIVVDPAELYPRSFSLLTKEAVQLYFDRMTPDGLLMLHISSKEYRFEPVVARVAKELKLAARVWNDDAERRPGKTASSWVVLARDTKSLGNLYSPLGDLPFALNPAGNGDDVRRYRPVLNSRGEQEVRSLFELAIVDGLELDYTEELDAKGADGKRRVEQLNAGGAEAAQKAWLAWIKEKHPKVTDAREKARLELYAELIAGSGPFTALSVALHARHGHEFRRLETLGAVKLWTDEASDPDTVRFKK